MFDIGKEENRLIKRGLNAIDDVIATIALSGVIALTVINVTLRYVFSRPAPWVEEIALGLFIWAVFIGVSSAMKRGGHIGVDYFVNKMPRSARIVSEIIRAAAIYYVLIYVFIYLGYNLTIQASSKLTPILGIGYHMIDMAVPIAGVLATIHFTVSLIRSYKT